MCLLCFVDADAEPDWNGLWTACVNNPDGFGWSLHLGDHIMVGRSMDAGVALETYHDALRDHPGSPSMFHARWATHGTTSLDNCHPFYVGHSKHTVLAHNGVLPVDVPKGDKRSDTRVYAESILPKQNMSKLLDKRKGWSKLESWLGGSKLVVFTTSERLQNDVYIVNEHLGHWRDGSWWSNDSYRESLWSKYRAVSSSLLMRDEPEDFGAGFMDVCASCGSVLADEVLEIFGVCDTCNACIDCHAQASECLCYRPDAEWCEPVSMWDRG